MKISVLNLIEKKVVGINKVTLGKSDLLEALLHTYIHTYIQCDVYFCTVCTGI